MSEEHGSADLFRYFLGELPEEKIEEIEQKYFSNDESFEELQCAEAELIDSYVAGELSPEQKQKFEQFYLSRTDRRGRVQFAEALRMKAIETPLAAAGGSKKSTPARLLTAAAIIFAIAGAWLVREIIQLQSENRSARQEIQRLKEASRTLEKESKSRETKIKELTKQLDSAQMDEDLQPPDPIHGVRPQPTFLAVLMDPGVSRDSSRMKTIGVSSNLDFIRFELKLDRDPYPSYRVSLQTAGGEELWNLGLLKPSMTASGKTIVFDLPSTRIKERDYVLLLQGKSPGNKFENVSAYPFRVRKN